MSFRSTSADEPVPQNAAEAAQMAADAGLIYVSCQEPGIRRLRGGSRFYYLTPRNRRLSSARTLRRIASLAVPPAYKDVWICVDPRGHLQATGQDARGRKQYRYHPQWRAVRDTAKFDRMVDFGKALRRLRRALERDLALPGVPRAKVLAAVVTLLDTTRARIGNVEYARDNKSFGLTTLRNRHVEFLSPREAVLSFRGKSGISHELRVEDECIVAILKQCYELPGRSLFQYQDETGHRRRVDAVQVNDYLREAMRDEFTAKDFRTWGATLHALMLLRPEAHDAGSSERAAKARITAVIKQVAAGLGNTPAVCRKSYINPIVFDEWRSGFLHEVCGTTKSGRSTRRKELLLLKFLKACRDRDQPAIDHAAPR